MSGLGDVVSPLADVVSSLNFRVDFRLDFRVDTLSSLNFRVDFRQDVVSGLDDDPAHIRCVLTRWLNDLKPPRLNKGGHGAADLLG